MPYCLGLLLPFPLRPNQVLHVVGLIFFLEINFIEDLQRRESGLVFSFFAFAFVFLFFVCLHQYFDQ